MANPEQVEILKQGVEVWNQWRKDNSMIDIDLSWADLKDMDLSNANLGGAVLRSANLRNANLSDVNFFMANLISVDLTGAILNAACLNSADLTRADLSDADLTRADLNVAVFTSANLSRTNFYQAMFGGTSLCNTDLSTALGLDSVAHMWRSFIGIDTIYQSAGKIPHEFLRGAGVPDNFIAAMATLVATNTPDS